MAIAAAMPVKKATQAHLSAAQASRHLVQGRLAERNVEPEEVAGLAERRDPLSLSIPEPIEDLRHASRDYGR
jgi:hypothetical protein